MNDSSHRPSSNQHVNIQRRNWPKSFCEHTFLLGFPPDHSEASVQHLDAQMIPNPLALSAVLLLMDSLDDVGLRQGQDKGRQEDTDNQSPRMTLLDNLVL